MTSLNSSRLSQCLLLVIAALASLAAAQKTPRPDPYADPANDPYNPLRYITSNVLTTIATVLVLAVALMQTWCIKKWGGKWMMVMTIGAYFFGLGLALRFGLHYNPQSRNLYIVENLFVILSPCLFIAAEYILLGRLAHGLAADKYLLISPRRITLVFVLSDVFTFMIQGTGGGLSASLTEASLKLGARLFLIGLALQLVSFAFFTCVYALFLYRVWKNEKRTWNMDSNEKWHNSWKALAVAVGVNCVGILIRSIYRVIEMSDGFQSPLTRSESLFYILDVLPLFIAIGVYVPFWPGRFITDRRTNTLFNNTHPIGLTAYQSVPGNMK